MWKILRKKSRSRIWRTGTVILTFVFAFCPYNVLADTQYYTAVDGNQIPDEQLYDQVIEYDELGSLIHVYNTSVGEIIDGTEKTKRQYSEIRDTLNWEKLDAKSEKEDAEDEGDAEDYAENASLEAIYRSAAKSYNNMLDQLDEYSANRTRVSTEKELTYSAQSLMISYQAASLQKEYLAKAVEAAEIRYENTQTKKTAGLATEQEVTTAYNSLLSAEKSLREQETNLSDLYQSLCLLLGVDENGTMEVAKIPSADCSKLDSINLEEDTVKAVNNNSSVITERRTSSGGTTSGTENKQRTVAEQEEQVRIQMKQLYQDVQDAKAELEAAQSGYSSAQITWENAQKKYAMGMLDRSGYIQAEMAYMEKEIEYKAADLSLFQALQVYDWAVKGIMSTE